METTYHRCAGISENAAVIHAALCCLTQCTEPCTADEEQTMHWIYHVTSMAYHVL